MLGIAHLTGAVDLDATDFLALGRPAMAVKQAVEMKLVARVSAYPHSIDAGTAKRGEGVHEGRRSRVGDMFRVHIPALPKDRHPE